MNTSATDIAAWWGAVVATVVLIWDIIKWRLAGPRLRLTVQPGMKSVNMPEYEGRLLITFQVSNFGTSLRR